MQHQQHEQYQQQQQQQQFLPPPLPPGWIAATAPDSGRVYYANPTTGETSWDPPVVIPPPLPPPPVVMQQPQPAPKPFNNELEISAGKIADMCRMQPRHGEQYQSPLESHLLSAQPPHVEEARLEIRLATLYDQLKRQSL